MQSSVNCGLSELTSQADSRVWAVNLTGQFLSENISGGQHLNKVQMYQNTLIYLLFVLNNTFQSSEMSLNLHGLFLFLSPLNIRTCKKFILFT